ncbi:ATP-dependent RNA helicase dbp4, partial [Coemansia sp. RSA 2618]
PVVRTVAVNPNTGLPVVVPNIPAHEMSKRQQRKVKEKIIKNTRNTRVVFDDEGNARPIYEMQDEASFRGQGDVHTLVDEFQQRGRAQMDEVDVDDRETARQKRREKRLARKIREREELGLDSGSVAMLASDSASEDDDMEEIKKPRASRMADSDESEDEAPKRRRVLEVDNAAMTLEDQEQLALRLLGGN